MALDSGLLNFPIRCPGQSAAHSVQPKRVGGLAQFGCPVGTDTVGARRLAELGWIEGQDFTFDCESAVGRLAQVPALARELVPQRPDVLADTVIE